MTKREGCTYPDCFSCRLPDCYVDKATVESKDIEKAIFGGK